MPLQALPFGEDCAVSYFEVHIENAGDVGYSLTTSTSTFTFTCPRFRVFLPFKRSLTLAFDKLCCLPGKS
jgi:hypothetical protein